MNVTSVRAGGRADAATPGRRRRRGWLARGLLVALAGFSLFACYLRQSRTVAVGSDGASQALQAWDLLHGNPLLHGWWVTDVSFYPTELPEYALLELARGLTTDVIHVAGALTYTLLVLAAALLARGRTRGTEGATRALIAAGIMLAPPLGPGTQTLLLAPDHTGTGVPVLLVFLLIDWSGYLQGERARGAGWYVPVLAWLGLTGAALADTMAVFIAVIPLALTSATRAWHGVAARREPLAAYRREAYLALAAVLAVPAALAAAALIRAHGGYQVNGLRTGLAGAGQLAGNARLAGEGLLELFGANVFGAATAPGTGLAGTGLAVVHLAGLALAVTGVAAAARRFLRPGALIESVLVAGIAIDLAAYLAGVQAVNILSTREIVPVLPFAAVLAGRRLAVPCPARCLWLGVVLALYAAGLGAAAARPPAAPQYAGLAAWLRAHQLTAGLSGYHEASIVTLETGGAVTLRPVTAGDGGRLAAYAWNASAAWFDPAAHDATFLVLAEPGTPGASGLTTARAVATFGRPSVTYQYEEYAILVWRGANLLTELEAGQSGAPAAPKHQ